MSMFTDKSSHVCQSDPIPEEDKETNGFSFFNMQNKQMNQVFEVSASPYSATTLKKKQLPSSRDYLWRLGSQQSNRKRMPKCPATKSQITDLQFKYFKYKSMMQRLKTKIIGELSREWQFDSKNNEIKLKISSFDHMTDKMGVVSEKLILYAEKLRTAGFQVFVTWLILGQKWWRRAICLSLTK